MMDAKEIIIDSKIIAIARGIFGSELLEASKALYDGGIRAFEVAFEQSQDHAVLRENAELTAKSIGELISALPSDAAIGAGTVLTEYQAEAAFGAGASFVISPNVDEDVIGLTKKLGMISVPGAMTPTEIVRAYSIGADIVKVFPAGILGVEYFKAVRAPLAHIPLAAVAGITIKNIADFEKAGAAAYGISSSLYFKDAIKKGDMSSLKTAAEAFYKAMKA